MKIGLLLMVAVLCGGCSSDEVVVTPAGTDIMSVGRVIQIMPVDQVLARMEILEFRIAELEKKCKVTTR